MDSTKRLSGKSYEAFELDWDTNYFGVLSAKAVLKDNVSKAERNDLMKYLDKFKFITVTNNDNNSHNNIWIGKETTAFLADMNIQFTKELLDFPSCSFEIGEVIEAFPGEARVIEIAKNAFLYSRFFNDRNLLQEKAQNVYVHWIESALNQVGRYFTVFKKNNIIAGFLLFSINEKDLSSTIELIAVDKTYRGCNIGKSLINTMDAFIYLKGITKVKVGTQVENVSAARFYIANGFRYVGCNAVYHYWPQITSIEE